MKVGAANSFDPLSTFNNALWYLREVLEMLGAAMLGAAARCGLQRATCSSPLRSR